MTATESASRPPSRRAVRLAAELNVPIEEITAYLALRGHNGQALRPTDPSIRGSIRRGLSAAVAATYLQAGITSLWFARDLHAWGCTPDVVRGWFTVHGWSDENERDFFFTYRWAAGHDSGATMRVEPLVERDLRNALLRRGHRPQWEYLSACETLRTVAGLGGVALPADRIVLLAEAGVTAEEVLSPEMLTASNEILAGLAALRQQ